jgi:hypothetical protein
MTDEELQTGIRGLITKEELRKTSADLEKEVGRQRKWIIALNVPTWLGIIGLFWR